MKKVLFIDRDGTLVKEPPVDFQLDAFEKLEFVPGVFKGMKLIKEKLDYEIVMVTNQDGLGTSSFPKDTFWPVHNFIMKAFENEGVTFDEVFIDPTMPEENAPTRKPGTAMLTKYLEGGYDLENSFVIGDRLTDVQLAKNLGSKAIFFQKNDEGEEILKDAKLEEVTSKITESWDDIYEFLFAGSRTAEVVRATKETDIVVKIDLDGSKKVEVSTGLDFFDHMLDQIGKHAGIGLYIKTKGDLQVDEHHTMEDTALALGEAIRKAIGDKRGIERYGYCLPMDESLAIVALDFGGRPWFMWDAEFKREYIGDTPTEMFKHFFKSFSDTALCNLNIKVEGDNEHHKIEGIFKAFAKSIKMAIRRDVFNYDLPSTKGVL